MGNTPFVNAAERRRKLAEGIAFLQQVLFGSYNFLSSFGGT
jgi:hypothetical protein